MERRICNTKHVMTKEAKISTWWFAVVCGEAQIPHRASHCMQHNSFKDKHSKKYVGGGLVESLV